MQISLDGNSSHLGVGLKKMTCHSTERHTLNQVLMRQTSRSHYGSKVPAVTVTVFKYRNKIGKIVVKAVPYSVKKFIFRYQYLVEIYSVSAEKIIRDAFSYSENV
jgi:hypothetical protein